MWNSYTGILYEYIYIGTVFSCSRCGTFFHPLFLLGLMAFKYSIHMVTSLRVRTTCFAISLNAFSSFNKSKFFFSLAVNNFCNVNDGRSIWQMLAFFLVRLPCIFWFQIVSSTETCTDVTISTPRSSGIGNRKWEIG